MMNIEPSTGHVSVDATKESLASNIRGVITDTGDMLKEVAHSSADEFAATRERVGLRMNEARSTLTDARNQATEQARATALAARDYVEAHPWQVLGATAATGFVIGYLFSHRH